MKNVLKSIGAVLAGIAVGAALSHGTDYVLESAGILPHGNLNVGTGLVLLVVFYRLAYNVVGCYVIARLAPSHPLGHALVAGVFGLVLGIVVTIATAHMNIAPLWYGLAVAFLFVPSAWLGARWATNS
jgi:hypothetical protein